VNGSRVVIVTGASSGLGRAMALALLAAGHRVVVFARGKEAVDEFVATAGERWDDGRVLGVAGSVRSASDCEHVVETTLRRFGEIGGLVNNAGVHLPATRGRPKFYELPEEQWRSIVDTHLNGSFLMARAVVPHLLERGWGRIVNHETSYDTMLRAGFTPYGAAKAGLEAATAGWADELAGTGVTVNAILPGGVANVPRITADVYPDRSKLVQPDVMGPPIVWLMSRASDGINGYRFTSRLWNADASDEENVRVAGARAGWR
jgi:NAD(P)-dependent dehydrogenase (short-subunit alcohol dehydrogenase family)